MSASKDRTVWFGMKVTPEQKARIKRLARKEGTTAKQTILTLVNQALDASDDAPRSGSFLEGIEHLVGSINGPIDLSTHPDHMRGFGR